MSKHIRRTHVRSDAEVEFRTRSARRLTRISDELNDWLEDWFMGEIPPDALSRAEYPFNRALEDLAAEVSHAADLLRQVEFGDEHEPRHRAEGIWMGDRFVSMAELAFRTMVARFEGGYHPDTTQYIRLPVGYTQERVDRIEREAEAVGVDLYSAALSVIGEALS